MENQKPQPQKQKAKTLNLKTEPKNEPIIPEKITEVNPHSVALLQSLVADSRNAELHLRSINQRIEDVVYSLAGPVPEGVQRKLNQDCTLIIDMPS